MKQVIPSRSVVAPLNSSTTYANPAQSLAFTGTQAAGTAPWRAPGAFSNLIVKVGTAPGSGKSWAFTLMVNGVATALTVTISNTNTTGRDTSHTVSIAANDTISLRAVPTSTPAALGASGVRITFEFDGTNAAESGYATAGADLHIVSTRYTGLFQGDWWNATATLVHNVAAVSGNVTSYIATVSVAPGSGKSWTFTIYKNGVKQDGSGGAANTTITISNAAVSGSASFTMGVTPGNTFYVEAVPTGAPAVPSYGGISCAFTAATDGESQFCGVFWGNPFTAQPQWTYPATNAQSTWVDTTEANLEFLAGVNSFTLAKLYVALNGTPGATKNYIFTLRKNSATPSGAQTVTISDSNVTGNDTTGQVSYDDGDTLAMMVTPTNNPTSRQWSFGMAQGGSATPEEDEPIVTIAGVLTPIKRRSLTITESANARNVLSCDVISTDGTYRPAVDAEVNVYINGVRIFAGTIDSTSEYGIAGGYGAGIFVRVQVNDFNSLADRRYVHDTLAGGTLKSMLQTLVDDYLDTFGVTLHPSQVNGPTLDPRTYDYRQVTEVLSDLADLSGYVWEIDYDKQLIMYAPGTVAAPFDIIENDGHAIGDILVDQGARTSYANRIILRYGSPQLLDFQESFTGDGTTTAFQLTYTPVDGNYATYRSLIISNNGSAEPVQTGGSPSWTYTDSPPTVQRNTAPANGNTILVRYFVQFPQTIIAEDTGEQAIYGIIEKLIEKSDTFDAATAQAEADAELAIALERPTTVRYDTLETGLRCGQTQTITVSARNINADYLITEIVSTDSGDAPGTLIRAVTAIEGTTLKPTWREYYKELSSSSGATAPVAA